MVVGSKTGGDGEEVREEGDKQRGQGPSMRGEGAGQPMIAESIEEQLTPNRREFTR